MSRKLSEAIHVGIGVTAALLGVAFSIGKLAIDIGGFELAISFGAVVAAALAGAASMYIARATKTLSREPRIFISYSRDNKQVASELRDALAKQGAKVWFDVNDLQPGSDFASSIESAIESSNTVVAVVSNKIGTHLTTELRAAMDRHVPVLALVSNVETAPEYLKDSSSIRILTPSADMDKIATEVLQAR